MKTLMSLMLTAILALSLTCCGKETSTEQTVEQKKVTEQFQKQFETTKKQAEKLLAEAKEKANAEGESARETVQHAVDSSEKLVNELKDSGGKAWEEKKPVVDAAIKDLTTKVGDALAKMKLGDIKIPTMVKDARPSTTTTQKSK